MSTLVNASITPITSQAESSSTQLENSPSTLSVTTRIDYNLRFTKKAIMVVADNQELYSHLASEFLTSISDTSTNNPSKLINVAFFSASSKLNDLQVRCRIIEQLFMNTPFDPETSLVNSIMGFAQQQSGEISIIIDHAQALSLQLKYELCKLVEAAKKKNLVINVVLFGTTLAAQELTINKNLVKDKLVLIEAVSGQVISLNNKGLKPKEKTARLFGIKAVLTSIIVLISMAIVVVITPDAWFKGKFVNTIESQSLTEVAMAEASKEQEMSQISVTPKEEIKLSGQHKLYDKSINEQLASSKDIHTAMLRPSSEISTLLPPQAQVKDVMKALQSNSTIRKEQVPAIKLKTPQKLGKLIINTHKTEVDVEALNEAYYQDKSVTYQAGYVIQIAGFTDKKHWQLFINNNEDVPLFSYKRKLNDKTLFVITSVVYPTKDIARDAMTALGALVGNANPWLKSISEVNREINTFKG